MSKIPYEQIRETGDRSWSFKLIDRLANADTFETSEIQRTLACLDDHRVPPLLIEILCDVSRPTNLREAASDALLRISTFSTQNDRMKWWNSRDTIIERHAVRMFERSESKLLESIACNPRHPYYIDAIRSLQWWEEPHYQKLIMRALSHPDAAVREMPADSLLWEQPVEAEAPLLNLAIDDRSDDVSNAALNTLCYYASIELLLKLDDLQKHGRQSMLESYRHAFNEVTNSFSHILECTCGEAANVQTWLEPARHLLSNKAEKQEEKPAPTPDASVECSVKNADLTQDQETAEYSITELIEALNNPDGSSHRTQGLRQLKWNEITGHERDQLANCLLKNEDHEIRSLACTAFTAWQDRKAILTLMHDRSLMVRRSAAYTSKDLSKHEEVAQALLSMLNDQDVTGCFAKEALESYIAHTSRPDLDMYLLELASTDQRPSLRQAAIDSLPSEKRIVEQLIPFLSDPPQNTWTIHSHILRLIAKCDLRPKFEHLLSVDDLWLQEAIAESFPT